MGSYLDLVCASAKEEWGLCWYLGIFHNQLPALIRFPLSSTLTTTIARLTTTVINPDDDEPFFGDDPDSDELESTTVSLPETFDNASLSLAHFDDLSPSSSINVGLLVSPEPLPLNWWNLNDTASTVNTEDDWIIFNTTSMPFVTRLEHLSADDEESEEIDPVNHHRLLSTRNSNSTPTTKLIHLTSSTTVTSSSTNSLDQPSTSNATTTTTHPSTTLLRTTTKKAAKTVFEYCKGQQCHNGGRLNSDCLCICLPAFTGQSCQTGTH